MNQRLFTPHLILLCLLAWLPVSGQDLLQPPAPESQDRLNVSFRMAFNVSASFKTGSPIPAPGITGVNRNYDDGYNRVDSIGNAGGYTHYWGYDHDNQYDAANHAIRMHSFSGSAPSSDGGNPMQPGVELTYNRELGRNGKARWGLETAVNYMNVSIRNNGPVRGALTVDTYLMPPVPGGGFVIPPPAPYHGAFDSTGIGNPAIYDTPSDRAIVAAVSSGTRDFNADVIGWRVGPYLEIPVGTKATFSLSGGFSLVGVLSDYRFNETVSYYEPGSPAELASLPVSGSGSHAGLLAGGYVGGGFLVPLGDGWSASGGAQFQYAGNYTQQEGASQARLDLSQSIFVSIGATYSF